MAETPLSPEVLGVELVDREAGRRTFYRDVTAIDRSELPAGQYEVTELRGGPAGVDRRSLGTISADAGGMQTDGNVVLGFLIETGTTYGHVDPDGEVTVLAGAVEQENGVARAPAADVDLKIELSDPDGNSLGTKTATTNDSGNARVTYDLDSADPGMYSVEVRSDAADPVGTDRLAVGPYTALPFHRTGMTVGEQTSLGVFSAVGGTPEEEVTRDISVRDPDDSEETIDVEIGTGGVGLFQFTPDAPGSYRFSGVESPARGETIEAGAVDLKALALDAIRAQYFDDSRETMVWGALVVEDRVPVSNRDLEVTVTERRFGEPDQVVAEFTPTTNDLGLFTIDVEKAGGRTNQYQFEIQTVDGADVFLDNDVVFFREVPEFDPPGFSLTLDGSRVAPGGSVEVEGTLLDGGDPVANETVSLLLTYESRSSGSGEVPADVVDVETGPDGSISTTVDVPTDAPDGEDFRIEGSVDLDGEVRAAGAFGEIRQYAVDVSDAYELSRGETITVDVSVRDRLSDDPVSGIDVALFGNRDHVDAETFDAGATVTDANGAGAIDLTVPADATNNVFSIDFGPYSDASSARSSPVEPFSVEVDVQPASPSPGDTVRISYTADIEEPVSALATFPNFRGAEARVIQEGTEAEFDVPEYLDPGDTAGNAQLLVVAASGDVTRVFASISLSEGLSASFQFTPAEPRAGQSVEFEDTSTAGSGTIESYEWVFGDGATATGPQVTHTYDSPGEYAASLTVTTAAGDSDTATETVTVTEAGEGPPAVVGTDPPRDLDGDGLYEDIDGDGELSIGDVQQFFQNRDADVVQNNAEFFNFSAADTAAASDTVTPEEVTIGDVQALFQLFQQQ